MVENKLEDFSRKLWEKPNEDNWKELKNMLKKNGAKYYKVFYKKGDTLNKVEDLRESYVEVYNSKEEPLARLPVFKQQDGKMEGALINLEDLQNTNR